MGIVSLLVASLNGFHPPIQVEFQRHEVDYYDGRIMVDYRVKIDISAIHLQEILTDYEKFSELSPLIVNSTVNTKDDIQRVSQTLRPCVLGVCYSLKKEETLSFDSKGRTVATIIPQAGHFESGVEQWFVESTNQGTILHYHADLTPAFPIPPLVGPFLLKKIIHKELTDIVFKLL